MYLLYLCLADPNFNKSLMCVVRLVWVRGRSEERLGLHVAGYEMCARARELESQLQNLDEWGCGKQCLVSELLSS